MNSVHEIKKRLISYNSYESVLNYSWVLLKAIQASESKNQNIINNAAFRFALIQYCIPYFTNYIDERKKADNYHYKPEEFLDLHNQIVNQRHKFDAHRDMMILDPKVHISKSEDAINNGVSIVENVITGMELYERIDEIIVLIELTIERIRNDIKELENELLMDE